ncbi:RHS repeat domain-containing protein [Chryseobacterium shigense]|uniref:YD repeat-containing protein n=1 Tax=Chryseobacterium shigense TaxID=297244 RepID=A0A841N805_9FLAO|nr:RHS repeat domain-containing protein [Chryseobacterium shigense]MBB6369648.1 YD repeat-containing protein [Chryseobacterium shigense]
MRKLLLSVTLISGLVQAQRNFGGTPEPMPSVSSFSSYVNTPVSLSTGVPNISIPLFSLPTGSGNLTLPVALSYHTYNAAADKPGSEVGLGWSLMKAGVISRILSGVDERFSDSSKPDYQKNQFYDIYYYDIPGNSGKFKFVRDINNNTFTVNNISGNNVKIEYTRTSNTATLIVDSFTITDGSGLKYIFEDYSLSRTSEDTRAKEFNYKSAFFLTRITDQNNVTVANFSYQKNNKYIGSGTSYLLYQNCKLETISTKYGKIVFENGYASSLDDTNNDAYSIKSVSLLDSSSRLVSKYRMEYADFHIPGPQPKTNEGKRTLWTLDKLDKNQQVIESRKFRYDTSGSETSYSPLPDPESYGNFLCPSTGYVSPTYNTLGLLKQMDLPEGGSVVYNFEAGTVYLDKSNVQLDNTVISDPDLQYLDMVNTIGFDTNTSRNYTFQVSEAGQFFVSFIPDETYVIPNPHGDIILTPTYKLANSAGTNISGNRGSCREDVLVYNLVPGTYTFKITGNGNGSLFNYRIKSLPQPYKNRYFSGTRIANIKYYESSGNLKKTISYDYDSFSNPNNASGESYMNEVCSGAEYEGSFVLYRNIKEIYGTPSQNTGYTKYYYKTPNDYSMWPAIYRPYYNIVSSGLLVKKEVFNAQNQLMGDENTDYVLEEIPTADEYALCSSNTSKAAWLKSVKTFSKNYYTNGSSLQNSTETIFNASNFQPSVMKETSPEGKVTEKKIKYAGDLNNTRLSTAGMTEVPLLTEVRVNGALVDKSETKYDNVSNFYPSSVMGYNVQNQNEFTAATLDVYDDKGNLVQVSDKSNVPVTTIWGYDKTQPIAKIEGLAYSQVMNLPVVIAAINASNADAANPANEASLLQALENLRKDPALKNYSVTAYTYDPLIGITNSISPNGIKTIYLYDHSGRLVKVTDASGKTLKEYQYNYKH